MTRSNNAHSVEDLLAAGGGMKGITDVMPTVVQKTLQELIEAAATARLCTATWNAQWTGPERDGERVASRTVSIPVGDVEVKIPKLRKGCFFPDHSAAPQNQPGPVRSDYDHLRDRHIDAEAR